MRLLLRTDVNQSLEQVAAGFDEKLFEELAPPFPRVELERFDGSKQGHIVAMTLHIGPIKQRWVSEIVANGETEKEWYFIDEGRKLPSPLKAWQHRHRLRRLPSGGTRIIDDITYSTGSWLLDSLLYPALLAQFLYRKPVYRRIFR